MAIVCVTGAAGKVGRATVTELLTHGHQVVAVDIAPAPTDLGVALLHADMTDYGQTAEVLHGVDSVIHLANIPAPGLAPPAVTYHRNSAMNANVFLAAAAAGLRRVVWSSSETTLGLPFDVPPRYAPVDEDHFPLPTSTYALSKVHGESMAGHIAGWSRTPFIGLRLSNVMLPEDYRRFPSFWPDATLRRWNLWGYIDARDAASACRLALDAPVDGSTSVIIAAADTVMNRPSMDLLAEVFPEVPVRAEVPGFGTLLAIDRARALLDWAPRHSWRDQLPS